MTAVAINRFRPDRHIVGDLALRLLVVLAATSSVALEQPSWLRATLSIAAALVTAQFFVVRYRRNGLLDAILRAVGGTVVILVLLGLVLDVLPFGLDTQSWGIGVGVIEAATLTVLATLWPPVVTARRRRRALPVAGIVWSLLIAGVLAGALIWSVDSVTATHTAPLALGERASGTSHVVTVSSGSTDGPYELDLVTASGRTVLASGIRVGPRTPSTSIRLPVSSSGQVELLRVGGSQAIRTLILSHDPTSKATP